MPYTWKIFGKDTTHYTFYSVANNNNNNKTISRCFIFECILQGSMFKLSLLYNPNLRMRGEIISTQDML